MHYSWHSRKSPTMASRRLSLSTSPLIDPHVPIIIRQFAKSKLRYLLIYLLDNSTFINF